jgi:putative transposase
MAWEPGNLKTDTNTYYNITLFSSANTRKKLLVSRQISDDIKQFLYEICQRHSVIIRYMETDKDHIHYMIETEPTMSISKIVNLMKSYTTYHI